MKNERGKKNFRNPNLINEDLTYLINNSKEMEKMLLGTSERAKNTEERYEEKIFVFNKEITNLNDQKQEIDKLIQELKSLMCQFEVKYTAVTSSYLDEPQEEEVKKNFTYEISSQIYYLYSKKLFNEANEIWKRYNYHPLVNIPIERSYEILTYLTKVKDRQIKQITKNYYNNSGEEYNKQNNEILGLLSGIELYKTKLEENEIQLKDLKTRLKTMINDNNELFTQNQRLKYLIENK